MSTTTAKKATTKAAPAKPAAKAAPAKKEAAPKIAPKEQKAEAAPTPKSLVEALSSGAAQLLKVRGNRT